MPLPHSIPVGTKTVWDKKMDSDTSTTFNHDVCRVAGYFFLSFVIYGSLPDATTLRLGIWAIREDEVS